MGGEADRFLAAVVAVAEALWAGDQSVAERASASASDGRDRNDVLHALAADRFRIARARRNI